MKYYGFDVKNGNGHIVRMLRERLDWTQDMLARTLGVSKAMVSKMEHGQIEVSADAIEKICNKFDGVTAENFNGKPVDWSSVR